MRTADWLGVERLVLPHRAEALRAAGLILGQRQLAEDAVQEACIRAAFALPGLRDTRALRAWFRRIAVREALRLAEQGRREVADPDPKPSGWEESAEECLSAADEREQARRALATLPPGLRAAVALHHGLGLPVAETASILGVPAGTVKSRCAAARHALRTRLDRPLAEVLELAEQSLRLMNREWVAAGNPESREAAEADVRALFPEVSWPAARAIGLPFSGGRSVQADGVRMGWAFYGDDQIELGVFLSACTGDGWHTNVRDDAGDAVKTETSLGGVPATWVTRSDGAHFVQFEASGVQVGLGGNLPAERIRDLAESTADGGRSAVV